MRLYFSEMALDLPHFPPKKFVIQWLALFVCILASLYKGLSICLSECSSICPLPLIWKNTNHLKSFTNQPQSFLDASLHLYNWVCPSVLPYVHPYVHYLFFSNPINHLITLHNNLTAMQKHIFAMAMTCMLRTRRWDHFGAKFRRYSVFLSYKRQTQKK